MLREQNYLEYDVKCHRCSSKAIAFMIPKGTRGTYRESLTKFIAVKIICISCKSIQEADKDLSLKYELWYSTDFKAYRLWAYNQKHLQFLINYLQGNRLKRELTLSDRAMIEAFPKWLILAKHRKDILKRLQQLSNKTVS